MVVYLLQLHPDFRRSVLITKNTKNHKEHEEFGLMCFVVNNVANSLLISPVCTVENQYILFMFVKTIPDILKEQTMVKKVKAGSKKTSVKEAKNNSILTAKKSTAAKFRAILLSAGKTATGFVVPSEVVESLGSGKKPAVLVTIKGHTYRNTVATMGGKFMIGVSAENREKSGVSAGEEIDIKLELDTEPREVVVPADFRKALTKDEKARRFFEGLSYSNKRRHVLSIEGAKTAETRERRIDKAIAMLRDGRI